MSERWMRIGRMLKLRYRYYLLFQSKLHIAKRRVRHPLKLGESKKKKKRNIRKRVPTDPRRKDYRIEANRPKDSFNEERKKKKKLCFLYRSPVYLTTPVRCPRILHPPPSFSRRTSRMERWKSKDDTSKGDAISNVIVVSFAIKIR